MKINEFVEMLGQNCLPGFLYLLIGIIGVAGSVMTEQDPEPGVYGYLVFFPISIYIFTLGRYSIGYYHNIICMLFWVGFGCFYIISSIISGEMSWGWIAITSFPFIYLWVFIRYNGSILMYLPWFVLVMLFGTFCVAGIVSAYEQILIGGIMESIFSVVVSILSGYCTLRMCTTATPGKMCDAVDIYREF